MFNLISKIKYFRTYLIGRCFRRWHKVCLTFPAYMIKQADLHKPDLCNGYGPGMRLACLITPKAFHVLAVCTLLIAMSQAQASVSDVQEVRRKLFARVRHSVCSKLFLAKPTFCQHLVEINQFVSDISQVKMSYCNSSHLYQLEEYSDLQVVTREQKAKPALESTSEKVQQVTHPVLSCSNS